MVTRLPFGSKLWRLFSSTMPHPTWFYNTQLGMIHETQAFVQVVNFLMLAWSWSWFVMIFYLLSNVKYWWRSSMIFDLATMLVLVMLPLSMIVGVVDSSNEAGCLGIKMSSWCLHCRFTARNLNRKCWRFFCWQLWRPVIKMSSLRSLSYLELFVVVAFVVFSPLYCSIMQHFVCVV